MGGEGTKGREVDCKLNEWTFDGVQAKRHGVFLERVIILSLQESILATPTRQQNTPSSTSSPIHSTKYALT